ncbi:exopolysaccharide biosynthesis glycosyltransferase VpsK [Arachidicoccus ginsenosidivorans]
MLNMQHNIPSIRLLNCPIHAITMDETVNVIDKAIKNRKQIHHVVVNAAKLVKMKSDPLLRKSVINCDIINADGQSLVWAARLLGLYLPERVAGIDLMERLVMLAYYKGYKIYLLGAKPEVVSAVANKYAAEFDSSIIAGYRDGYFSKEEEGDVARAIGESQADILFVAMSSPKKEVFLNEYKRIINTSFIMGVGGSFDVVAGKVKRAPFWMQKSGLEWLYRVIQEPRRMWKRYLVTNTLFIGRVFNAFLRKRMSFFNIFS